jgi:hypothetical protein
MINRPFSSLANKRLVKALEKELEYEQSQYKVDESVAPFLQESGFEIIDLEGTTQVILKKKFMETKSKSLFVQGRLILKTEMSHLKAKKTKKKKIHRTTVPIFKLLLKKLEKVKDCCMNVFLLNLKFILTILCTMMILLQ